MGTSSRGYGHPHQRLRKALLPGMPGSKCTRCGEVLKASDQVDLDHTDDRRGYLGWAHASCNRRAGAIKRNAKPSPKNSREW